MPDYHPYNMILYISLSGLELLHPEDEAINSIGGKALGLSSLPESWTLPFLVVSADFAKSYFEVNGVQRQEVLSSWVERISKAANTAQLNFSEIIVRSSGTKEGLAARGDYYSITGTMDTLAQTFADCFAALEKDKFVEDRNIPLILQSFCKMHLLKGHLSNERRFCKDARDWVAEYEGLRDGRDTFAINIREWRKSHSVESFIGTGLIAKTEPGLVNVLEVVARWALSLKARVHFEWVWDGSFVYLVQADEDKIFEGVNPCSIDTTFENIIQSSELYILELYPFEKGKDYPKLNNVGIYHKLGLSVAPLYVLHDQQTLSLLHSGIATEALIHDLELLIRASLVIRMDVTSLELTKRQLLPRTDGINNIDEAVDWLIKMSQGEYASLNPIFLFHNFVPAQIAAFAYASPGMSVVYIEALWGLPEGLYHYSHDKIQVDTRTRTLEKLSEENMEAWSVQVDMDYKQYIVAPDESAHWVVQRLGSKYGWGQVLTDDDITKKIALGSRLISEEVNKGVSIMWFVGVDSIYGEDGIMPWHHETYDVDLSRNRGYKRKKTVFDKEYTVRSLSDLVNLKDLVSDPKNQLRWIKIQPIDNSILRDKEVLKDIGSQSLRCGATIYLEGGQLSHAYYQLLQTGASVEVASGFKKEERNDYNKLVRDRIPGKIFSSGENVFRAVFTGSDFLYFLKEKLVEEALELFDAKDDSDTIAELADVLEVIDGICEQLGINFQDILDEKQRKANKVGGFKDGSVLLRTSTVQNAVKDDLSLWGKKNNGNALKIVSAELSHIVDKVQKVTVSKDQRILENSSTSLFTIKAPLLRDKWLVKPPSTFVHVLRENPDAIIEISAERKGKSTTIRFEASIPIKQPSLLDYT